MLKVKSLELEEAVASRLTENGLFCAGWCEDCDAIKHFPATQTDPEDETCPAEFNITDGGCIRHDDWLAIVAEIRVLEEIAAELVGMKIEGRQAA